MTQPTQQISSFQCNYLRVLASQSSQFQSSQVSESAGPSQLQKTSSLDVTTLFKMKETFLVTDHIYSDYKKGKVTLCVKSCHESEEKARNIALKMAKFDDEQNEFSRLKKCDGGFPGPLDLEDTIVSYFSMKLKYGQTEFSEKIDYNQQLDKIHSIESTRFYSVLRVRQYESEDE